MMNLTKLLRKEHGLVQELYQNPSSTIINSCLQGYTGEIWVDSKETPKLAIMYAGKTLFIGGANATTDIIPWLKSFILQRDLIRVEIIPEDMCWYSILSECIQENTILPLQQGKRHLMQIQVTKDLYEQWKMTVARLPEDIKLVELNQEQFDLVVTDRYLHNFVCCFENYYEFQKMGMGYFLKKGDEIIGGASSFTRYNEGIEVQIAVNPDYRGRGLAKICGARLLMECYHRNLYPNWDCANPTSESVARSLGYVLKQEVEIYRYIKA